MAIYGSGNSEVLYGSASNNTIYAYGGNDKVYGYWGNDVLFGGDGLDHLFGGEGADRLYGGNGDDFLWGGNGRDVFYGGAGSDQLIALPDGQVDTFVYSKVSDSTMNDTDQIWGFELGTDLIDLTALQLKYFTFVGGITPDLSNAFAGNGLAGVAIWNIPSNIGTAPNKAALFIDANGDGTCDMRIGITTSTSPAHLYVSDLIF